MMLTPPASLLTGMGGRVGRRSSDMTRAINNPFNGSVVLRGVKIDLDRSFGK
jgi:hypothetical protein